MKEEFQG